MYFVHGALQTVHYLKLAKPLSQLRGLLGRKHANHLGGLECLADCGLDCELRAAKLVYQRHVTGDRTVQKGLEFFQHFLRLALRLLVLCWHFRRETIEIPGCAGKKMLQ